MIKERVKNRKTWAIAQATTDKHTHTSDFLICRRKPNFHRVVFFKCGIVGAPLFFILPPFSSESETSLEARPWRTLFSLSLFCVRASKKCVCTFNIQPNIHFICLQSLSLSLGCEVCSLECHGHTPSLVFVIHKQNRLDVSQKRLFLHIADLYFFADRSECMGISDRDMHFDLTQKNKKKHFCKSECRLVSIFGLKFTH